MWQFSRNECWTLASSANKLPTLFRLHVKVLVLYEEAKTATSSGKKSVSHVEATLIEDIERAAQALFASVYSLGRMPQVEHLQKQEREFWKRYETARRTYEKAKKDTDPIYFILTCLRTHLPHEICAETVKYL